MKEDPIKEEPVYVFVGSGYAVIFFGSATIKIIAEVSVKKETAPGVLVKDQPKQSAWRLIAAIQTLEEVIKRLDRGGKHPVIIATKGDYLFNGIYNRLLWLSWDGRVGKKIKHPQRPNWGWWKNLYKTIDRLEQEGKEVCLFQEKEVNVDRLVKAIVIANNAHNMRKLHHLIEKVSKEINDPAQSFRKSSPRWFWLS